MTSRREQSHLPEKDDQRYATATQETWDFGTVRPVDRQAIIDRRNKSYDYSSDDTEEPTGPYLSSPTRPSENVDPFATVKDMRKLDLNLKVPNQYAIRHDDGPNPSTSPLLPAYESSTYDRYDTASDHIDGTMFTKSGTKFQSGESANTTDPSSVASREEMLGPGSSYHQTVMPVINEMRRRAEGYPVALKSIDQLHRCLLEIEADTNGLIDTFVVSLVKRGVQENYHKL